MSEKNIEFFVMAIFGHNTRQPMLSISYGPKGKARELCKISPEDAITLAMNLLQAAEASLSDAFIFTFAEQKLKATPEHAAHLLLEYRQWREGREQVP